MESNCNFPVLSILATITLFTSVAASAASSAADRDHSIKQMDNIMDALIGAGDFGNWASILTSADPSVLPMTATLFIPSDADYSAVSSANFSPFLLFPYHIVPQRLSFSDLCNFPINTRLSTLLPGFSLLFTNTSLSNFSIDGVPITHPNLYQNAAFYAHGIAAPLDYTVYGNFDFRAVYGNSTTNNFTVTPQSQPPRRRESHPPPAGELVDVPASGSAPLWMGTVSKIWGVCGVLLIFC